MGWFSSCGVTRKGCKLNVASSPCGNVWWSSTIFGKGKRKKERRILCVKDTGNVSVYTQKDKSGKKKKKRFQKYTQKKNYLRRVDDFWLFLIFYQTCLVRWKRAKKKEKKSNEREKKRNKRETKEKRKREEMRIIYIFVNQSQYELWLRKYTRTSKQRFLYL